MRKNNIMAKKNKSKPIIETMINGAALILISTGTTMVTSQNLSGLTNIVVGVGLEFFKYWGRKNNYW